jgi:hypothetical protein
MERFQRLPIIDRIDPRQLDLIKRTVAIAEGAQAITNAELGHFLELCAVYGLDPFAREAWIAKSKSGKLLIMVGRDGLRKVAKGEGSGEEPGWKDVDPAHVERIEAVLARAAEVEFPGFADRATTQMRMVGQSFAANEEFVAAAEEQIAAIKPTGGEA